MSLPPLWVLDTNIVLDLWVFHDPQVQPLRQVLGLPALDGGESRPDAADTADTAASADQAGTVPARWLATPVMREELARVLAYPHLVRREPLGPSRAEQVLAAYDRAVTLCPPAPKARFTCTDADDQKFIDLAAAHACPPPLSAAHPAPLSVVLLSKDRAVLRLHKRLATLGVWVGRTWTGT